MCKNVSRILPPIYNTLSGGQVRPSVCQSVANRRRPSLFGYERWVCFGYRGNAKRLRCLRHTPQFRYSVQIKG